MCRADNKNLRAVHEEQWAKSESSFVHRPSSIVWGVTMLAMLAVASHHAHAQVAEEKQYVLDWLSKPEVVKRFGKISEAIWSYAELGLQEYKSSALLIQTLEQEGFKVEKGLAGDATRFAAHPRQAAP